MNKNTRPPGYVGRASTLVAADSPVRRPRGAIGPGPGAGNAPTAALDYEIELAAVIGGAANPIGQPVSAAEAPARIFGLTLLCDWSARDIQAFESRPLGPCNGKSFATSVGPWVVPLAALAPHRRGLPPGSEAHLPAHLRHAGGPASASVFDIELEAEVSSSIGGTALVSEAINMSGAGLRFSFEQMVAALSANGAVIRPGDLIGSGTLSRTLLPSGPLATWRLASMSPRARSGFGCLLEATYGGRVPLLGRNWLADGDMLTMRGAIPGQAGLSLGEIRGRIQPAV